MLNDETLKAVIEAIIYVAPEPVSLDAIVKSLEGEERERVKTVLSELVADFERPQHGVEIRQVAGGYKFSSKPEHHEMVRKFVKSLKPLVRLSKPALETLAVIAYRQPVTLPEIDQIRGVDCGGVIHTLLEKKLVVTAGRKNVVGRPILYRTSRDFLVHFGLKDVGDLPSLREFEEMARQALGSDLLLPEEQAGEALPFAEGVEAPARDEVSSDSTAETGETSGSPEPPGAMNEEPVPGERKPSADH
jgi:segregation and condensation protein B